MTHLESGRPTSHRSNTRHRRALAVAAIALVALGGGCGSSGGGSDGGGSDGGGGGSDGGSPANSEEGPATVAPTSQHFDSDFAQVCRGTGVDWATPYDPATTGPHKVVVLQGPDESDLTSVSTGNDEWDVLFDTASDAYAEVALVTCAIRTDDELAQTCTGYQDDDGTDSGNTVEYHSATYAVTLREATTADVIDETTIEAEAGECPLLAYFDEGETTVTQYADVDANTFLLPYATT